MAIDEQAGRAEWDEALRQGYRGTYAEWQHDMQDWIEFRSELLAGNTETDDFYIWKENKAKVRDLDLSYATAKELGFKGSRDQWAKFINTMRGPSAYTIWIANNAEDIQDIFGKAAISEKEWSDMLFSSTRVETIAAECIERSFHEITESEIDSMIDQMIAEREQE